MIDALAVRIGLRTFGIVKLVLAGVILLVAALMAMSAWSRWSGIADITAARTRLMEANDERAKARSSAAARELPDEPAAVLLDIDLTSEADFKRLEQLERRAKGEQRILVQTAEALSLVLRNQDAREVPGADGMLLKALADLGKGVAPAPLALSKDSHPHYAVMAMAYAAQLQAALQAKDVALVRQAAGVLALLMPSHPQGPAVAFISGALDPACDLPKLQVLAHAVTDQKVLQPLARCLSSLSSERANELDAIALGVNQVVAPGKLLEAQVQAAVSHDAGPEIVGLVRRCFDAGRLDLVKQLLPKLPAAGQTAMRNAIVNQEGDLVALAKVGSVNPLFMPRLTTPACRPGHIAFHVSNDLGTVPKTPVAVRLNGVDVAKDKIIHTGSLYSVETNLSGPLDLEVRAGEQTLFAGKVTL